MTRDEFLHKYHYYQTNSIDIAIAEADAANAVGIDDAKAVAVMFPGLGYCLMLDCAADFCIKIGIPVEVKQ